MKLGLVGLAAMVVGGLLTWMVDWWASPLDAANKNRFDPANFGFHGVAPIGYAAFAFALGATAGVLLRRTVPAMAATLVGFVAARLAVEHWVRPNLAAPLHKSLSLAEHGSFGILGFSASTGTSSLYPPSVSIPNDWVLSTAVVDKSGHALTGQYLLHACPAYGQLPNAQPNPAEMHSIHDACINKLSRDLPHGCHLPAGQPLLAVPVGRDGDLPRGCAGAVRAHLLVAATPVRVTRIARCCYRKHRWREQEKGTDVPS